MTWLRRLLFRREKEWWERGRGSDSPDPLPEIRSRALTLPLPPNNGSRAGKFRKRQRTYDQESSAFFKLPYEIRYQIYQEILAPANSPELHIAGAEGRLVSRRCVDEQSRAAGRKHTCWGEHFKFDGTLEPGPITGKHGPEDHLSLYPVRMGLLRSCRLMYSESIEILYSQNVLSFYQTRAFLDFQHTILPQRLHSIRSLHLSFELDLFWEDADDSPATCDRIYPLDIPHYWDRAWKVIAGMKSLHSVRVTLGRHPGPFFGNYGRVGKEVLLYLLGQMTAVSFPTYTVEIQWAVDVDELVRELRSVPFEIYVGEISS